MSATIKAAITALKGRIAAAYSAISAKGGTLPATQDSANLASAIDSIPSGGGSQWTGHIDEVGLRAIGWIDRDIEWLRGLINWNEEEDDVYKVPQELIDAYVAAGNTWSENLSLANKDNWWFKYRPRGGEAGSWQGGNHAADTFLLAFANYETYPWNEMRAWGTAAKWTIVNNNIKMQASNFWTYSPPIVQFNVSGALQPSGYWFRNNSVIEEIRGILDFSAITTWVVGNNLNSATKLRVIWIKNLKVNFKFVSAQIAKVCVKYLIDNEAATSAITITLPAAIYTAYSTDANIVASLTNHPNISLISA